MLIGFGISPSRVKKTGGAVAFDADAEAFFTAASITDNTQKNAVNQLVLDLKSYNIWTKMKAIYPFIGGTASTHKWNLKDPQDTNAAYRLSFIGGWTHTSNGALPNGTNAYADTFFISNGVLNLYDAHMSFYSRNSLFNAPSSPCLIGVAGNSGTWTGLDYWALGTNSASQIVYQIQHSGNTATDYATTPLQTSKAGFWIGSRRSSDPTTLKISKNGSIISNATTNPVGQQTNIYSVYISAMHWLSNSPTFVGLFDNSECAFSSIGNGLTDSEIANFRTAVQTYQTTLGRQV